MPRLDWLRRPIAHRGLHDAARSVIENTPSAVAAAIGAGYAIELDLQEAADGTPMVFHDDRLDRLTVVTGPLRALAAAELVRIPFKDTSDRMQTLAGLLEQVAECVPLVLEIKSDWGRRGPFERRIAETLASYGGQVALMSFDPASVAAIKRAAPAAVRGLVADRFPDATTVPRSAAARLALRHLLPAFIVRPHFVAYDVNALPALAPVAARRIFQRPLLTWTVRTPAQRQVAERWADAMIFEGWRP